MKYMESKQANFQNVPVKNYIPGLRKKVNNPSLAKEKLLFKALMHRTHC